MPTLADKIFVPISIFVLNIVLAVFKFLLVSAVGACFTIYARCGGEYANSVRWVRSAGYLEMIHTFLSTSKRKNVPSSVKLALIVGLFATLVASILDKGIASLITPATSSDPLGTEVITSPQFTSAARLKMFLGWNLVVPSNGSAVVAMKKSLNSTIVIPNQEPGQVYTPVTSGYNTTCTDFGIELEGRLLKNGGDCGTVSFRLIDKMASGGWFLQTERSPNRWNIVMSTLIQWQGTVSVPLNVGIRRQNSSSPGSSEYCEVTELYRIRGLNGGSRGVTDFPRTSTTKCFFSDGEIAATALTTTRFISPVSMNYTGFGYSNDSNALFVENSDELFLAMKESIRNTVPSLPARMPYVGAVQAWVELRVVNSTIEIYVCGEGYNRYFKRIAHMGIECIYGAISVLQFRQPFNNAILEKLEGKKPTGHNLTAYMTLEYFTEIVNGTAALISIEKMKNDTMSVTEYMAQLGTNHVADFSAGKLHIQYEVKVVKLGLEVPLWVLSLTGIIAVASLLLWKLTDWLIGSPYNSSLYLVIRDHLASVSNTPVPRLMQFRFQPLMFEDAKLLPDQVSGLSNESRRLLGDVKSI